MADSEYRLDRVWHRQNHKRSADEDDDEVEVDSSGFSETRATVSLESCIARVPYGNTVHVNTNVARPMALEAMNGETDGHLLEVEVRRSPRNGQDAAVTFASECVNCCIAGSSKLFTNTSNDRIKECVDLEERSRTRFSVQQRRGHKLLLTPAIRILVHPWFVGSPVCQYVVAMRQP